MNPTSLTVEPVDPIISIGDSVTLVATVLDENGDPYTGPEPVVFTSLTPALCSVSATGLVTALDAGTGAIQVTCGAAGGGTFPNIRR